MKGTLAPALTLTALVFASSVEVEAKSKKREHHRNLGSGGEQPGSAALQRARELSAGRHRHRFRRCSTTRPVRARRTRNVETCRKAPIRAGFQALPLRRGHWRAALTLRIHERLEVDRKFQHYESRFTLALIFPDGSIVEPGVIGTGSATRQALE